MKVKETGESKGEHFMIVEQIMQKNVITLHPDETLETAIQLMNKHHIRHIPITTKDHILTGIVSDRDLKDASPSIFQSSHNMEVLQQPLHSIMTTNVITGHPLDFVEEISAVLYEYRIGCLPILKHGKVVGIVTESDLLHTFVQLTGAHQPGSHIEVKVSNVAGMLAEVSTVFQNHNVNISSVLVYPDHDERYKVLVFRVQTMNTIHIVADLEAEGYTVLWPSTPGNVT